MFKVKWQASDESEEKEKAFNERDEAIKFCEALHNASMIYSFNFIKQPGIFEAAQPKPKKKKRRKR